MTQTKFKIKSATYPAGTIVVSLRGRYQVQPNGSWKLIDKEEPKPQEVGNLPICEGGINLYTKTRCYCEVCKAEREAYRLLEKEAKQQ